MYGIKHKVTCMEVYSYLVDYCMYACSGAICTVAIPQCTTIEHEYGLQGHQLILSLPVAVYYKCVGHAWRATFTSAGYSNMHYI